MTSRLIRWPLVEPVKSADEIMCLFNAARVIVKGSLVSIVSLSPVAYIFMIFLGSACNSVR